MIPTRGTPVVPALEGRRDESRPDEAALTGDIVQARVLVQLAAIALRADCPAKRMLAAGGIATVSFS
jgi:hypothetical protein